MSQGKVQQEGIPAGNTNTQPMLNMYVTQCSNNGILQWIPACYPCMVSLQTMWLPIYDMQHVGMLYLAESFVGTMMSLNCAPSGICNGSMVAVHSCHFWDVLS